MSDEKKALPVPAAGYVPVSPWRAGPELDTFGPWKPEEESCEAECIQPACGKAAAEDIARKGRHDCGMPTLGRDGNGKPCCAECWKLHHPPHAHASDRIIRAMHLIDGARAGGDPASLWEHLKDLNEHERGVLDTCVSDLPALLEKLRHPEPSSRVASLVGEVGSSAAHMFCPIKGRACVGVVTEKGECSHWEPRTCPGETDSAGSRGYADLHAKLAKVGELVKSKPFQPKTAKEAVAEQGAPTPNDSQPIWGLVVADMLARNEVGIASYGTPLQAFNGRNALLDAYQESLDQTVYLRQAIEEKGLSVTPIPPREVMWAELVRLRERETELQENGRLLWNKCGFFINLTHLRGRKPLSDNDTKFLEGNGVSPEEVRAVETLVIDRLEKQIDGEARAFTKEHSDEIAKSIEDAQRKKVVGIDEAWSQRFRKVTHEFATVPGCPERSPDDRACIVLGNHDTHVDMNGAAWNLRPVERVELPYVFDANDLKDGRFTCPICKRWAMWEGGPTACRHDGGFVVQLSSGEGKKS